jgi:hypothetical protein
MNALEQSVFRALLSAALACAASCGGPTRTAADKERARLEDLVLDYRLDAVSSFSEGRAAVRRGVNWAYVDESGKFITRFIFARAQEFSEGLACVQVDSKYGYIDRTGAFATPVRSGRNLS